MNPLKRVVIFGATSAIAEQVARNLVSQGSHLYCVGRNSQKLEAIIQDLKVRGGNSQRIDGYSADLTDIAVHQRLIDEAKSFLGEIDAVLIAHGTLPNQQACQASVTQTLREVETNALSVVTLLTPLANLMEEQQHGVIAVISSVAGDRGRQ